MSFTSGILAHVSWVDALQAEFEKKAATNVRYENCMALAKALDPTYRTRAHLEYLSDRLAQAVKDVENGQNRMIRISMPPRSGKSDMGSQKFPMLLLNQHPDWKIGLISSSPSLATSWGRNVRRMVEEDRAGLGVKIAPDAGAISEWETTKGGGVTSRSVGQKIIGRGFKVLIIDDAVADFAAAHSDVKRDSVWDWWLADAQTRLEPPYLVVVIGTRWHEDDIIGRLGKEDTEGDPADWEVIEFPALAVKDNDELGRMKGDPLISPLVDESKEQAIERWNKLKDNLGSYAFAALYQQTPVPSDGAVFNMSWIKYWTRDPSKVSDNTVLFDPGSYQGGRWLDSWDLAFKATKASDYVVGQRWLKAGANRYLIAQFRKRIDFTQTVAVMEDWANPGGSVPYSSWVFERLVEDKANGPAIISVLKNKISGIIPINPKDSKEARARAITPEIESGNVYFPHPSDPGNDWVNELLDEMRSFPSGTHDDTVDALSQALNRLRSGGQSTVKVAGKMAPRKPKENEVDQRNQLIETRRGQASGTFRRIWHR